jgi:uridine kinase
MANYLAEYDPHLRPNRHKDVARRSHAADIAGKRAQSEAVSTSTLRQTPLDRKICEEFANCTEKQFDSFDCLRKDSMICNVP